MYHEQDLVSAEWLFFSASHGKGPANGLWGAMKGLAADASLQRVCSSKIWTLHEFFNFCSGKICNIAFSYVQEEQILKYRKGLAGWFDIAVAVPGTQTYCWFKPLNSRAISRAVILLSTSSTTLQIAGGLMLHSKDMLVSQMIIIFLYVACDYGGYWWLGIFQERWDNMFYIKLMQPHGPNSLGSERWLQLDWR